MSHQVSLPIDQYQSEISDKILSPLPVILSASPGSGKTTRVPAALLKKCVEQNQSKKIIVIVPKRISALSAASRIAEENNWQLGNEVGYVVRFESAVKESTQLIFMTDGMFLKKMSDKNFMKTVGYVFLDEFHERKANMDLILGLLFEQKILHNNIQIIVMSATMNINLLKQYFQNVHIIEVKAPPYEIKKIYLNSSQRLTCDTTFFEQLRNITIEAWSTSKKDILIFLPGLREINKAIEILKPRFSQVPIEILHGSMSLAAQRSIVLKEHQQRRLVLATNIAESSLTLPDLDCVIDSGLEKNVITEKKIGFSRLKTDRISLFSSYQREGRAARTQNGFCFKLWHPVDERSMKPDIEPEVLNSSLHNELLCLAEAGTSDFEAFSWLTAPTARQILSAQGDLLKWKLINSKNEISDLGKAVNISPVNITNSILLIELLCFKNMTTEKVCDLIARLDQIENTTPSGKINYSDDLERILDTPLNSSQNKLKNSLGSFSTRLKKMIEQNEISSQVTFDDKDSLAIALFKVFAHYFSARIIAKKMGPQGLSSTGRGVEAVNESTLQKFDFYAALFGEEKNDAVTLIKYGVGVSKTEALKILGDAAVWKKSIFFEEQVETFFQQETLFYGSFKLNEKSKVRLSPADLNKTWKEFSLESPTVFLELNTSFKMLKNFLNFVFNKKDIWNLQEKQFSFLENFDFELINKTVSVIDSFEDFKNADFTYYVDQILPESVHEIITQLPQNIRLPNGKTIPINYTDPKAPMISAKIQDFFGWTTTPQLLSKIPYTLELLAPNMRPTQITNDLAYFWKNSYLDVRKDLRARYPKHSWPEDPTQL